MNRTPADELGPVHQLVRLEYGHPACRCGYNPPLGTRDGGLREVLEHVAEQGAADLKNHDGAVFAGPTEWDLSGSWNHELKPDSNGDPVCKCGWDPSNPRTSGELIPATQLQAAARVLAHLARIDRFYTHSQAGAAAGILPQHPNPAPHLTAQQRLDDARAALHAAALEYAAAADALNNTTEPHK